MQTTNLSRVAAARLPRSAKPYVLVPYRNRPDQLPLFLEHFRKHFPELHVLIIEQSEDGKRFNRGALLNYGIRRALAEGATTLILHDVDLLPKPEALGMFYTALPPAGCAIHLGWAWYQKYSFPRFLGGVVLLSAETARQTNGYPNDFWGWGGEDDALRERLTKLSTQILRPWPRTGYEELPHPLTQKDKSAVNPIKWELMTKIKRERTPMGNGYRNLHARVLKNDPNHTVIQI